MTASESRPIISLENINLTRNKTLILKNANWQIHPGENWVLLGPNGCGKSSLINAMLGYLWPTSGKITVLGETLGETDIFRLRHRAITVSESLTKQFNQKLTGWQVLLTGLRAHLNIWSPATQHEQDTIAGFSCDYNLESLLHKPMAVMSTGERQRILIARAMLASPRILILDEPYAGLDMAGREQIMNMLEHMVAAPFTEGMCVLLITHHLEEISPFFNRAALMKSGTILKTGTLEDVLTSEHLSAAFNFPLHVYRIQDRYTVRTRD